MIESSRVLLVCLGAMACAASASPAPSPTPGSPSTTLEAAVVSSASSPSDGLTPTVPQTVRAWTPQILDAARRHDVEPDLVALVVWLESNGQADARSPAGALGLMQMMPTTAAAVAARRGQSPPDEAALLDPERNLDLGAAHLAELIAELAVDGLDADAVHRIAVAYNGGHRVLERWQRGEPLPEETRRYAAALRERWQAR